MEEMKAVQMDLHARPLTNEVQQKITSTEDSLRGYSDMAYNTLAAASGRQHWTWEGGQLRA
jgi:hypothetical protein